GGAYSGNNPSQRRDGTGDTLTAPNNLVPVNPHIHDQIHAAQAHTPQALDELAKQQGWPQTSKQERE
ncbi:hypothetical protein ACGYU4_29635, partial [Burkholderia pseudomallei]